MKTPARILIKLRPQASLAAAAPSANLRPLFESSAARGTRGLGGTAAWYVADVDQFAAPGWDAVHARESAKALGLDDSAILFAEPDLEQSMRVEDPSRDTGCAGRPQDSSKGQLGDGFAWHLGDDFSQLASARASVVFSGQPTRIAHIDTGYDPTHNACPANILHDLERNFGANGNASSAADPNRRFLLDTSGHGTGTIGILAGGSVPQNGGLPLGGAPDADILPIRIADSVVLFFTSAFAQGLQYAIDQNCDVVSVSMGGLPSALWNETVNAAYEAGICIVAASGDCINGLPSHHVVYPARYHRTIAACGVMSNGSPYYDIPFPKIEGSWGPASSMTAALSAWTPNIPWARIGCPSTIDEDGAGTSASTPQIAAAVALWFEKYKDQLQRDWRRVEAVRNALFQSASNTDAEHLGKGILRALDALRVRPRFNLAKTPADDDSFAFFRVITGLGLTDPTPRERMLNLELSQRYLRNRDLQDAVPEPEIQTVSTKALRRFLDALAADSDASTTLRRVAASRAAVIFGSSTSAVPADPAAPKGAIPWFRADGLVTSPPYRRIRTYAVDPSLSTRLDTAKLNEGLLKVTWEPLQPGPAGEYIIVVDEDADGARYDPIDLSDPRLMAQDGFAPSEGNPQFHQQMAYAVAMTTIGHFERAIGRRVLWRPPINLENRYDDSVFIPQLRIYPHAFRQENAYYDPTDIALHFGYFEAHADDPGDHVPGSTVFTCLSHDIVAHETTHAILDGMHRRFTEPTNLDVLAFHEAFADIVALMQHFTMTEILEDQIQRTRGNLESESLLGGLALQFGRAIGQRGALRDAIGSIDSAGVWTRQRSDPSLYDKVKSPHARGALLVAAVFDAFLAIYNTRVADLLRIYTEGTGVLRPGAIHPDLAKRLAGEASKSASHVLRVCIRALDYVPPIDITFGEYLRALITADRDVVPDDPYGYRVAFIEAFRRRGLRPSDVKNMSVDSLCWGGLQIDDPKGILTPIVKRLKNFADACLYIDDRAELFKRTRGERAAMHAEVAHAVKAEPAFYHHFGIQPGSRFEIHALRRAERQTPDGRPAPQVIASITQERPIDVPGSNQPFTFFGGSTLIVDLLGPRLLYAIRKRIDNQDREAATVSYLADAIKHPLMGLLMDPSRRNRFGALHALADLDG